MMDDKKTVLLWGEQWTLQEIEDCFLALEIQIDKIFNGSSANDWFDEMDAKKEIEGLKQEQYELMEAKKLYFKTYHG